MRGALVDCSRGDYACLEEDLQSAELWLIDVTETMLAPSRAWVAFKARSFGWLSHGDYACLEEGVCSFQSAELWSIEVAEDVLASKRACVACKAQGFC